MKSKPPILNQTSRKFIAVHSALLFLLFLIFDKVDPPRALLWGLITCVAYSIIARNLISRYHRKGIALMKQNRYQEAIPFFEKSLAFFEKNSWIDRFRVIVLLSASAFEYSEMALLNIAFCYSQLGDGAKARDIYQECLKRFPNNGMAIAAIKMMDSARMQS